MQMAFFLSNRLSWGGEELNSVLDGDLLCSGQGINKAKSTGSFSPQCAQRYRKPLKHVLYIHTEAQNERQKCVSFIWMSGKFSFKAGSFFAGLNEAEARDLITLCIGEWSLDSLFSPLRWVHLLRAFVTKTVPSLHLLPSYEWLSGISPARKEVLIFQPASDRIFGNSESSKSSLYYWNRSAELVEAEIRQ